MNEILKFDCEYYEKYNTKIINIENGILILNEHCKVLKIDKTKYYYKKAVVQLEQPDLCKLMKLWEKQINGYLEGEGIPPITIVYNNKIYPKTIIIIQLKRVLLKLKVCGLMMKINLSYSYG